MYSVDDCQYELEDAGLSTDITIDEIGFVKRQSSWKGHMIMWLVNDLQQ